MRSSRKSKVCGARATTLVAVQLAAAGIQFVVFEEIAQDAKSLGRSPVRPGNTWKTKNKLSVRKM